MLLENYFENEKILHIGTCPNRSYYVPCADEKEAAEKCLRTASSRFQLLNGTWDFKYYPSVRDLKNAPWEENDFADYDRLEVPSCWKMKGYDQIQYTNVRYPFPFDPPYVPIDNPCGVYKTQFAVKAGEMRTFLNFEGVDSCFYLYINGKFVGYSQVSHCTHEFEVTDFVREGTNRMTVIVLKWCDGSYLEDAEGDVLIAGNAKDRIVADLQKVHFWNAEAPYPYRLILSGADEVISTKVGFRGVEIKGGSNFNFILSSVNTSK